MSNGDDSALYVVFCPSQRHDPPGTWTSAPASYADARRIELQHGMQYGLGHEDTQVVGYDAENPPAPPAPPGQPSGPSVDPQVAVQPQYDVTSRNFTAVMQGTLVLEDMTWVESRDHLLKLFDEPGLNLQVDTHGQVQLLVQVDAIKRSLRDLCESCHSALLREAEVHLQLQGGVAVGGGQNPSLVEQAAVFLSTRRGRWEYQLGADIQSSNGSVHGQVFGTVVVHFGGK